MAKEFNLGEIYKRTNLRDHDWETNFLESLRLDLTTFHILQSKA